MAVIHCRSSRASPFSIMASLDFRSCVCGHADTEVACVMSERGTRPKARGFRLGVEGVDERVSSRGKRQEAGGMISRRTHAGGRRTHAGGRRADR
jgi:hypothetical protein